MLQTVRVSISNLPTQDFGRYYQDYVIRSQDAIIDRNVKKAERTFHNIEDTNQIIAGINAITKEMTWK